jgi:hypothetical protein
MLLSDRAPLACLGVVACTLHPTQLESKRESQRRQPHHDWRDTLAMTLLSTLQMWIYEHLLQAEVMALDHHVSHDETELNMSNRSAKPC